MKNLIRRSRAHDRKKDVRRKGRYAETWGDTNQGYDMNENELLADVAVKVSAMYQAACEEREPPPPERFGQRVADMLAEDWGGINVYIPKGRSSRLQQRNARMWKEYTVDKVTLSELSRRYGLSEQRTYYILAAERERRRQKQHVLPGLFP